MTDITSIYSALTRINQQRLFQEKSLIKSADTIKDNSLDDSNVKRYVTEYIAFNNIFIHKNNNKQINLIYLRPYFSSRQKIFKNI